MGWLIQESTALAAELKLPARSAAIPAWTPESRCHGRRFRVRPEVRKNPPIAREQGTLDTHLTCRGRGGEGRSSTGFPGNKRAGKQSRNRRRISGVFIGEIITCAIILLFVGRLKRNINGLRPPFFTDFFYVKITRIFDKFEQFVVTKFTTIKFWNTPHGNAPNLA